MSGLEIVFVIFVVMSGVRIFDVWVALSSWPHMCASWRIVLLLLTFVLCFFCFVILLFDPLDQIDSPCMFIPDSMLTACF